MKITASVILMAAAFWILADLQAETGAAAPIKPSIIDQYKKALDLNPTDNTLRYNLGISLLQNGYFSEGVAELLRVYPERQNSAGINFNLGYAYLQLQELDKSFHYFNQVKILGGEHEKKFRLDAAWLNLGMYFQKAGNNDKAGECFNNALLANPKNVRTYIILANFFQKGGDSIKALEYLDGAMSIDEDNEDVIRMSSAIYNRLGVYHINNQNYDKARFSFDEVLQIDSSNLYAIYYLGYIDYLEGKVDSAATRLERLTDLKIEDENLRKGLRPLLFNVGLYYKKSGNLERAAEILAKVASNFPDFSKVYYYAGIVALDQKHYDDAIDQLGQYVTMEPTDAAANAQLGIALDKAKDAHFHRGKVAYEQQLYVKALEEFEKVLQIAPEYGGAQRYYKLAKTEAERIEAEMAKEKALVVENLLSEGQQLMAEGELIAARQKFSEALGILPEDEIAKETLEVCNSNIDKEIEKRLGESSRQLELRLYYLSSKSARKVVEYDRENEKALENIKVAEREIEKMTAPLLQKAESYENREHFGKAVETYESVLKINPENKAALSGRDLAASKVEIYFNEYIGMARDYVEVEQLNLAIIQYKKALNLKPADDLALKELAHVEQAMGRVKSVVLLLKEAESALSKGKYNASITAYEALLKLEPKNSKAKKGLKKARLFKKKKLDMLFTDAKLFFQKENYRKAIKLCRKMLTLEKGERRALTLLKDAEKVLKDQVNPNVVLGKKYFDSGNVDEAIIAFHKVLQKEPGNREAKRYLSRVDDEKINAVVNGLIKKDYLSGLDAYTKGNYEASISAWNKVLELDPKHDKARLNIDKARRKLAAMKGG